MSLWKTTLATYAVAALLSRWARLLPLWLLVNASAYLLAPLLPLFRVERQGPCDNGNAMRSEPRLPLWLSGYDTPDNSLWGDAGWRTQHCRDTWDTYWGMVKWLWRNPAYGFERRAPLCAHIAPDDLPLSIGNVGVSDKPQGRAGYCLTFVGDYWHFCWVLPLGFDLCLYWNFGWKLKTYAEDPDRVLSEPIAQYVFSPRITAFAAPV